jgi:hypothetical protein
VAFAALEEPGRTVGLWGDARPGLRWTNSSLLFRRLDVQQPIFY